MTNCSQQFQRCYPKGTTASMTAKLCMLFYFLDLKVLHIPTHLSMRHSQHLGLFQDKKTIRQYVQITVNIILLIDLRFFISKDYSSESVIPRVPISFVCQLPIQHIQPIQPIRSQFIELRIPQGTKSDIYLK